MRVVFRCQCGNELERCEFDEAGKFYRKTPDDLFFKPCKNCVNTAEIKSQLKTLRESINIVLGDDAK